VGVGVGTTVDGALCWHPQHMAPHIGGIAQTKGQRTVHRGKCHGGACVAVQATYTPSSVTVADSEGQWTVDR